MLNSLCAFYVHIALSLHLSQNSLLIDGKLGDCNDQNAFSEFAPR